MKNTIAIIGAFMLLGSAAFIGYGLGTQCEAAVYVWCPEGSRR